MKRIICFILIAALMLPCFSVFGAETYDWSSTYIYNPGGRHMPYRPAAMSVSQQNPPSFTWPYVNNAESYDLKVCSDEGLSEVKYSVDGLATNYYCFPYSFEAGNTYYWSVRYHLNGNTSSWSEAIRFRIEPDAAVFTVDNIDELVGRVPESHPRIWTTADNLDAFRNYKNENAVSREIYDTVVNKAHGYVVSDEIPIEPETADDALNGAGKINNIMQTCAFAYLLTNDAELGQFAVDVAYEVAQWDYEEGATAYKSQDQAHRAIAYKTAMTYDWAYDLFQLPENENKKAAVLDMIKGRTLKMTGLLTSLEKSPYDSHGWTALGYIGIIGVAMHGELEEAESWLKGVLPLYIALLPPWSTQDGGWSQGTEYWKYSIQSNREFVDVLALAEIVNLYETAWVRNSFLWGLYAYPNGSYGSFGDGNNLPAESDDYIGEAMGKFAYFTGNTAAKWLSEATGGLPIKMESYYAGGNVSVSKDEPKNYPLGHKFGDVGWVVMTDNITDPDRIQMTFKSSPYGSYNHSHADQNSFYIQAFGEKLAIKSGFYDSYHSPHDNHITRRTFAHNSITVNDGVGQSSYPNNEDGTTDCTNNEHPNDNFNAKGSLEQYVNGMYFDSVTGDATAAYKDSTGKYNGVALTESVDRFVRSIIYLRPDVFVVVDELDAKADTEASFKWWLNAEHNMEHGSNYALISEGNARLQANVLYPADTTAKYYDGFVDLYGTHWPAKYGSTSIKNSEEHDRISFAAPKAKQTKMVVSMSVFERNDKAKTPVATTGTDYQKLSFEDGSCVIVNLKSDNGRITVDGITFEGSAVTYNNDAIMLTNGKYLEKDGNVLIKSQDNLTASIGCGRFSFSCNDDTTVEILKENGYSNLSAVDALTDEKGRQLSKAIGIVAEDRAEVCYLAADKGDYILVFDKKSSNNRVEMIPQNIRISHNESENALYVIWDEKAGYNYDIKINGAETENVTSPHKIALNPSVDTYSISVRAKNGGLVSDWSGNSIYSCSEPTSYSYVTFADIEKNGEAYIRAKSYITKPDKCSKLIVAAVSGQGVVSDVSMVDAVSGTQTIDVKKAGSNGTIRSYMWNMDLGMVPLTCVAEYKSGNTGLCGIYLNGELISDFDDTKNEYSINIQEGEFRVFPQISAVAKDNAAKVTVEVPIDGKSATIRVTAANGNKRTIKLSFNLLYDNENRIKNVSFVKDSGTNQDSNGNFGQVSASTAATLYYKENDQNKSIALNAYSKTRINQGGDRFGSRFCSDRPTNSGNYMELSKLNDELLDWNYFVLPNDAYYGNASKFSDEKLTFSLSQSAEIVVIGTAEVKSLESSGFATEIGNFGTARYINTVGVEDIYYNVTYGGRSKSEVDSNNRLKSYDYASEWVNVEPVADYSTLEDYESNQPTADKFKILGTCASYIQTYALKMKYSKIFDAGEMSLDLSGNSGRIVVIIKPIEPKPYISNLKYAGPKSYTDLSAEMIDGVVDSSTKSPVTFYSNGLLTGMFANGQKSWIDRPETTGKLLLKEDLLMTEGAYYIAPSYQIANSGNGYNWQKAYYYGMSAVGGNSYPQFKNISHDWISFDLNISAYIYVAASNRTPIFIDDTWEKVDVGGLEFSVVPASGSLQHYGNVYRKYIDVSDDTPVSVMMQTPGTGNEDNYYLIIKPFAGGK